MKHIIIYLFFSIPFFASAQYAIGKTRSELRAELTKKGFKVQEQTREKNRTWLVYTVTEKGKKAEFSFDFDNKDLCVIETIRAEDKESYKYYFEEAMEKKEFDWKWINENQYKSKFSSYMMIELAGETVPNQFSFFRTEWSKEFYDMLVEKNR